MSINDSILQIKLGDLKQLEGKLESITSENIRLRDELVDAKLGSSDSLCREYHSAFLNAMPIVRFAVSNMNPLSFRGWPHQKLDAIADALRSLPGIDQDQQETAGDLKLFAKECAQWERERSNGTEQEFLSAMNSANAVPIPV